MLIDCEILKRKWNVDPVGVLHVGAHEAEEQDSYFNNGFVKGHKIIWVEAQPNLVEALKKKLDPSRNVIYQAAIWDVSNEEKNLNIASNSQSSSLLQFEKHAEFYPEIHYIDSLQIKTVRLDQILQKEDIFDFLNLDIQGAELQAIRSLGARLNQVKWIYSEVNRRNLYKDCALVWDIDKYLLEKGFVRLVTRWVPGKDWGDALYVRKELLSLKLISKSKIDYLIQPLINMGSILKNILHRIRRYVPILKT